MSTEPTLEELAELNATFLAAWNEFTDAMLCGFCCVVCRQQIEIVRDRGGLALGLLCQCPAARITAYCGTDVELN